MACAAFYPIAISAALMDGLAFANPGDVNPPDGQIDYGWRVLSEGPFAGHTIRRVSITAGAIGRLQAAFLRWKEHVDANGNAASSAAALRASLTFPGNLHAGIEEAPWPSSPAPPDYPALPGQLNNGDRIWGGSTSQWARLDLGGPHRERAHAAPANCRRGVWLECKSPLQAAGRRQLRADEL